MKTVKLPDFQCGYHINEAAKAAISRAQQDNVLVEFVFNEITVTVSPKDSESDVIAQYQQNMDKAHTEYLASDEYKNRCKQEAEAARLRPIIFREKVADLATMTEAQLRDWEFPSWPETLEEVELVINTLQKRQHDYGTSCYAVSIASYATFCYMASKLGITGWQASCADLDILKRTRLIKGPFMIIKADDALYPQYDLRQKLEDALQEWEPWLKKEASKNLEESESDKFVSKNVLKHWKILAK